MALVFSAKELRQAMRDSLPAVDHAGAEPERDPEFTYVPPSHARALDPDTCVVEGIRGAGKSFWWAHLSSKPHQKFITGAFPEARINLKVKAVQAFGAQSNSVDAPSQDVLAALILEYPARMIWRAVCAHKIGFGAPFPSKGNWPKRVAWVASHPEEFDELLLKADKIFDSNSETLIILFDALDRLAEDWASIRPLAKGLLQVAQDLRATKRIRFKIFVRPDMLQDRAIIGFPDASKLLARKASLSWRRADLYALLFQCLGNAAKGGKTFRALTTEVSGLGWKKDNVAWILPSPLRTDESVQERVFIALAGRAMASGTSGIKRGKPYTWLVNHLQDGLDQVSPRSFFSALRHAAEQTEDDYNLAIGYREIQQGVQAASQIRVDEITGEDYPWVDLVMQPLRGKLSVPCASKDIENIWKNEKTLTDLSKNLLKSGTVVKLPPQSLEDGVDGVLKDLEALGLVNRLKDERVQMPDVYRIAFGLGRRGGVKPLK
ncbi:hypothetical protein ACFOLJ_09955 [Rugamonas sp. CCM 8940]|uniref:hypothetical protein n=1 Tax=Rugamonas sp. CCM 8940 TaxID=2765359 RepID=UPI0018F5B70B|nr:hypothetical protein [Rugamonas sp. CCM 8940]MBJ7309923.1 hypothetical protein [Rugamonas sp. CCM 8940]